jgi:hypothetical protein
VSPTIRINEDTYEELKQHAEPFVDTPDSVIRRLLGLNENPDQSDAPAAEDVEPHGAGRKRANPPSAATRRANGAGKAPAGRARRKGKSSRRSGAGSNATGRAPRGSLLSDDAYEMPILQVLAERGGRGGKNEVIDAIEPILADRLTALDREPVTSGEIRWRNRAQFARLRFVQRGDMAKGSPRGIWEITDQGQQRLVEAGAAAQ